MTATILVASHSNDIRQSIHKNLTGRGYKVLDAVNGQEALLKLSNHEQIDLILTDNKLPDMDGFQLTRQIRKIKVFQFLPVVMLTSQKSSQLETEGLAAGITGWLCQPIDDEQFFTVIKRLMY